MSGKSRSEEGIVLTTSCPYVKSVTEKALRHAYASSFMQILVDEAEGGGRRTRDIRRPRRPLAGHRQGIRDAGGLKLVPQGEGGAVPRRPASATRRTSCI